MSVGKATPAFTNAGIDHAGVTGFEAHALVHGVVGGNPRFDADVKSPSLKNPTEDADPY